MRIVVRSSSEKISLRGVHDADRKVRLLYVDSKLQKRRGMDAALAYWSALKLWVTRDAGAVGTIPARPHCLECDTSQRPRDTWRRIFVLVNHPGVTSLTGRYYSTRNIAVAVLIEQTCQRWEKKRK